MKRLLATVAILAALTARVHAAPFNKDQALDVTVSAAIYEQLCEAPMPKFATLVRDQMLKDLEAHRSEVILTEVNAKSKTIADQAIGKGVGVWCRGMETLFKGL